jgi:hypothetical protein
MIFIFVVGTVSEFAHLENGRRQELIILTNFIGQTKDILLETQHLLGLALL